MHWNESSIEWDESSSKATKEVTRYFYFNSICEKLRYTHFWPAIHNSQLGNSIVIKTLMALCRRSFVAVDCPAANCSSDELSGSDLSRNRPTETERIYVAEQLAKYYFFFTSIRFRFSSKSLQNNICWQINNSIQALCHP